MNIEVICLRCGRIFKTAVTESELSDYRKKITCPFCRKSLFLEKGSWRIAEKNSVEAEVVPAGQKKDSTSRKKARGKWAKKAHGEMTKRYKKK